jgi:hypothetical protein
MTFTNENKALVAEMIGTKKRLEDYPERYDPDLLMHEPASLPFGGTYKGLEEFKAFYPAVRLHICDDELAARSLRRNAAVTHKVAEP